MENKKKVKLSDCLDKQAGEKYNKLSDIVNNQDYRMFHCSDGMTVLDLMGVKHHIKKKIAHLPINERDMILIRYDRYSRLKGALGNLKKKAYGSATDGYQSILEGRKAEMLELFAMQYSISEIHKRLIEEVGLNLNVTTVKRFYSKYRLEIEKLQLEYEADYGAVGISRKRSRLEILDLMLRRIKAEFDKTSGKHMLPYAREMKNILEQARKEVEGEQIRLNIDGSINITATIESSKGVEQLYSDINFMTLLMSRVAARMRINPMMLNYQLTNSWYAKFTGIKRNDSIMDEEPDYPSKIILNWDDLQSKAEKKEQEYKKLQKKFTEEVEYEPVKEEESQAEKLRQALRDRLKEKQDYVDEAANRIKGIK